MFIDVAKIRIKAGDGGAGAIAFHREKYVAAGGPDGGDGGKGGDVIFVADTNLSTLVDFKYKRRFLADSGEAGGTKNCSGKNAKDLVIKVPKGTLVKHAESGRIMADLSGVDSMVLAKGGKGGWGNQHFATPTRQIPRFAKPGLPGEEFDVTLELKLLADVGLVVFPNVGKSTLISVVSEAKPKIANYHFTTLTPVLGVVKIDEGKSFVMADIPGLIEGASDGVGLGHEFLRHVDRCRLILHVVDISGIEGRNPREDFMAINKELESFSEELSKRPQIVVGNKCDMASEEQIQDFREYIEGMDMKFFVISAAISQGVEPLVQEISRELDKLPPIKEYEVDFVPYDTQGKKQEFAITIEDGVYVVDAEWLANILNGVDVDDYEALQYFQRVLRSSGIIARLDEMGINEGDTVRIFHLEFEYIR